ncbi:MAG: hypothetical protein NVV74_00805 [Magnetospirillum sp.]|nr:hypothetical protein [Magnetospirillum sp.]
MPAISAPSNWIVPERPGRGEAGERAQEGGLAGAIGTDDGDDLTLLDLHVDAEQGLEIPVMGDDLTGAEQGHWTSIPM